jgi:phage terminase large subunit
MDGQVKNWSPNYQDEWDRRVKLRKKLKHNRQLQEKAMIFYKKNPSAWIEDWCITYDPRIKPPTPRKIPFLMFPKQGEFLQFLHECLRDGESGLIEKSRDMGATWICCAFSVWLWLFEKGVSVGWGSRKKDLVHKIGDPDSIFEKLRMIIEALPGWMRPEGFDVKRHINDMKIVNPETDATIIGESGDDIGRGGRSTIYFKDESAHYERAEKIEAALSDNTNVQIDISSVNGSANVFYRRRMAGQDWHPGEKMDRGRTRIFVMDWRDHPNKTQEWYNLRRKKYEDEGLLHLFAQEVDRDYSSSVDRIIIPSLWVNAAVDAHKVLGFEADGERVAAQDVADEGGDKNALVGRHGVILKLAEQWGGEAGDAADKAIPECLAVGINELYYDSVGVGSGFKSRVKTLTENGAVPDSLKIVGWNGGQEVLDKTDHIIPNDYNSPTNEQFFENLKAQAWWRLRIRFKKTYDAVTKGVKYSPEELISLPSDLKNLHLLKMQLSQAVHKYSKKGKTMVDKKPKGAVSPNLADACTMCYCPTKEYSIFDIV